MAKKKVYHFHDVVYPIGKGRHKRLCTMFPLEDDPFHPLRVFVEEEIGDFIEIFAYGVTEFWPVYGGRKNIKHSK